MAIEYAAKPRLEARKVRILGSHEARQNFAANVLKLTVATSLWGNGGYLTDAKPAARQIVNKEIERSFAQIDAITAEMFDNFGSFIDTYYAPTIPGTGFNTQQIITRFVCPVRGLAIPKRPQREKAKAIAELTAPFGTWFFASKWHTIKRIRAMQELLTTLEKYSNTSTKQREFLNADHDQVLKNKE